MKYERILPQPSQTTRDLIYYESQNPNKGFRQKGQKCAFSKIERQGLGTQTGAPLVVLVHGRGFAPQSKRFRPVDTLYLNSANFSTGLSIWAQSTWANRFAPRNLVASEFTRIGYGWQCDAKWAWRKNQNLVESEVPYFAGFLQGLRKIAPNRPIHLMAHNLAAQLCLRAIETQPSLSLQRIILLDAEAYISDAILALTSKAGEKARFYNFIGADARNLPRFPFKLIKSASSDHSIRQGFPFIHQNWVDIPYDHLEIMDTLLRGEFVRTPKLDRRSFNPTINIDQLLVRILYAAPGTDTRSIQNVVSA